MQAEIRKAENEMEKLSGELETSKTIFKEGRNYTSEINNRIKTATRENDLLKQSAVLIREWNNDVDPKELELLGKQNQAPLVLVLMKKGPCYLVRSKTDGRKRFSHKMYYSKGFEALMVSIAVQCRGKLSAIRNALFAGQKILLRCLWVGAGNVERSKEKGYGPCRVGGRFA